jgi:hypothetical protein
MLPDTEPAARRRKVRFCISTTSETRPGLYPGDSKIREQLTPAQLDALYRVLGARVGQQLRSIAEIEV